MKNRTYNVKLKLLNIVPKSDIQLRAKTAGGIINKSLPLNMYLRLTNDKYCMSDIFPETYQTMEHFPIEAFDISKLDELSAMFAGCETLKVADLSSLKLEGQAYAATTINGIFKGCKNLSYIKVPKMHVRDMYQAFFNCQKLETVDLSEADLSCIGNAAAAFRGCSSLKNIIGTIDMSGSNALVFNGAFKNCSNLKELKIKNPVKEFLEHDPETGLNKAGLREDQYEIVD